MPTSRTGHIPLVLETVRKLHPKSVLDVGVGWGKWGVLFREYLDIVHAEDDFARYYPRGWQVHIVGIEGFRPYITALHRFVYDDIVIGLMQDEIRKQQKFDVIFLGDVIEHVPMPIGATVLRDCLDKANTAVIVATPARYTEQGAACGNRLEMHHCRWVEQDFADIAPCKTVVTDDRVMVAIYEVEQCE